MPSLESVNLEDVLHDLRPLVVIHKDGRVTRLLDSDIVPPGIDRVTGVESKDIVINPETGVYVRMYKPQKIRRAGVIVYYHGGGFCVFSAASSFYHSYVNTLAFEANMIVVSVDYRVAPEHPLPIGYEDSWDALKWLFKRVHEEPWIRDHVDFSRVFLVGDSAGANIVHNMAMRVGKRTHDTILRNMTLKGIVLIDTFFWGKDRIGSEEHKMKARGLTSLPDKVWMMAYPESEGSDDPHINPGMDPKLCDLGVDKVMVCVAGNDPFRDRGFYYKELLLESGWKGDVHVMESLGEEHVFHLDKPDSSEAAIFMRCFVEFLSF